MWGPVFNVLPFLLLLITILGGFGLWVGKQIKQFKDTA